MDVAFGAENHSVASRADLASLLANLEDRAGFELWIYARAGPSMCLLRNDQNAWLMYLRFEGDSGFTSIGDETLDGMATFELSNGQIDEYPLSWCVPLPQAWQAIEQFFVDGGARPQAIAWNET